MDKPKYKRIMLKLSGEALQGELNHGIEPKTLNEIALQIKEVHQMGVEIAVVVGGGNIFRGVAASTKGMNRANADYMGMLATVINCLALQDALEKVSVEARVMSAIDMRLVTEAYTRNRAIRHLEDGRIVIFGAGTGNPFFTTDTAAALRAMETDAEVIMKATKVDGIYTADPMVDPDAKKIEKASYMEVIEKKLRVMDTTAVSLCMENRMPILVFNMTKPGNILKAVMGETIGTRVEEL